MFSAPTEILTVWGVMCTEASSSSVSWEWVVLAGWMMRDFSSATLASRLKIFSDSVSFWVCSLVPFTSKVKMHPAPLGKYFS